MQEPAEENSLATVEARGQELAEAAGVVLTVPQLAELVTRIDHMVEDDPMFQEFSRQISDGANLFGGLRLGGGATWAPVRDPAADWSAWGSWEAWEECQIGLLEGGQAVGAIPTGGWLAWNSAEPAQVIGIPAGPSARKQAEMWALLRNSGKRTRVVPRRGMPEASKLVFADVAREVGAEVERLKGLLVHPRE
jgi:hypothetical protein